MTDSAPQRTPTEQLPVAAENDYRYAWRQYAVRRRIALFFVFGWLPFSLGAFALSRLRLHIPEIMLALILLWLGMLCASVWWAGEFRCPRCRRRFGALGSQKGIGVIWRGLFDKICYNCKLRKFQNE